MDCDRAAAHIAMQVAVVNEHAQFVRPDLAGSVSEDEQHRINHVRLATAVRADDRRESLEKINRLQSFPRKTAS